MRLRSNYFDQNKALFYFIYYLFSLFALTKQSSLDTHQVQPERTSPELLRAKSLPASIDKGPYSHASSLISFPWFCHRRERKNTLIQCELKTTTNDNENTNTTTIVLCSVLQFLSSPNRNKGKPISHSFTIAILRTAFSLFFFFHGGFGQIGLDSIWVFSVFLFFVFCFRKLFLVHVQKNGLAVMGFLVIVLNLSEALLFFWY